MGVAVLNDKIYAVGGFDGSTGLNSAEVNTKIVYTVSHLLPDLGWVDLDFGSSPG